MEQQNVRAIVTTAIVTALIVGLGTYWLTPKATAPANSPSPTSSVDTTSWKTYTNTQYGFEFKYPSNLEIYLDDVSAAGVFSALVYRPILTDMNPLFSVEIFASSIKLNEFLKDAPLGSSGWQFQEDTVIYGTAAKKYLDRTKTTTAYLIPSHPTIIIMEHNSNHQILPTFRFTE